MLKGLNSGEDDRILFVGVFLGDLTVYYWIIILMGDLEIFFLKTFILYRKIN
jgi:hypothetical protein